MPNRTDKKSPVALFGAGGRMGQAIAAALGEHSRLGLGVALHTGTGLETAASCAVGIDFTTPEASVAHAGQSARRGMPLVIGTTGLSADQMDAVIACTSDIPILYSANMSVGITVLAALVEEAARRLGPGFDAEILEMHHRRKIDAPSGTALLLGEAAARGRGKTLPDLQAAIDRSGPRVAGQIGFSSLRGGDVAGDHTVFLAGEGERLELTHRASSRAVFAAGALRAAQWIIGRAPGLYSMRDVLGL